MTLDNFGLLIVSVTVLCGLFLLLRRFDPRARSDPDKRRLDRSTRPSPGNRLVFPPPPAPDPAILERLRGQAQALTLRGAIFAVTDGATVPGVALTPVGTVSVTRDAGYDATNAIARAAAARYPSAQAVVDVRQHPAGTRVEWRGVACAAFPDDPAMMPNPDEAPQFVLIDGSNVVNWERNAGLSASVNLATLIAVLRMVRAEGRGAIVVFDAPIGHQLSGRYLHDHALHRMLGGGEDLRVDVVGKGMVADRHLIQLALQSGAEVVTNDLYRDHPDARFVRKRRGLSVGGYVELLPAHGSARVPVPA